MTEIESLRERLYDLGFETEENEYEALCDAAKRAEQTIMNYCNLESVPEELYYAALDMAAGEYLASALSAGGTRENVKSISEGDVSVTFDGDGAEDIIDSLFSRGREEMVSFRRLKW